MCVETFTMEEMAALSERPFHIRPLYLCKRRHKYFLSFFLF